MRQLCTIFRNAMYFLNIYKIHKLINSPIITINLFYECQLYKLLDYLYILREKFIISFITLIKFVSENVVYIHRTRTYTLWNILLAGILSIIINIHAQDLKTLLSRIFLIHCYNIAIEDFRKRWKSILFKFYMIQALLCSIRIVFAEIMPSLEYRYRIAANDLVRCKGCKGQLITISPSSASHYPAYILQLRF